MLKWTKISLYLIACLVLASNIRAQKIGVSESIQILIDSVKQQYMLPGIIAAIIDNKGNVYDFASGIADSSNGEKLTPQHKLLSGSTGKMYFAISIMLLAEQGKLNLDQRVSAYLGTHAWYKSLPNASSVTVRQLLNHTAGMEEYFLLGDFLSRLKDQPDKVWKIEELMSYMAGRNALFPAGSSFSYADTHYLLLQQIIEAVTGKDAYAFADENIIKKLRLTFTVPSVERSILGLANGYSSPKLPGAFDGPMVRNGQLIINPQFEGGGGGFASNSHDLAILVSSLLNGKLLRYASLKEMKTPVLAKSLGQNNYYGLGLQIIIKGADTTYGHSGWFPGYVSDAEYFQGTGFTIAVQMNTDFPKNGYLHPRQVVHAIHRKLATAYSALSGKVIDESGKQLSGVSVHLLKKADSSIIKLTATVADGSFHIQLPSEPVLLKLTAVGYHPLLQEIATVNGGAAIFTLRKATQNLNAVTVRATRPLFQFLPDKTIVNIDAAPSNAGNSLFDVLQKIPDVQVDQDGNISINGKRGAVVLIDGRETFLSGEQLINLLRNTASSSVDQVEIISNPSARYDASFAGGILNIKTQKGKTEGFNGSFSPSAGVQVYDDPQGHTKAAFVSRNSLNYNYRKNKINIYGNLGYDRTLYYENFNTNRYFFRTPGMQPSGSYFSGSHVKTPGNTYTFRIAADFNLSKHSLVGISLNNSWDNSTSAGAANSYVATNAGKVEYLMRSTVINPGSNGYFGNYNLNYKNENPKKNVDLFSDISFLNYINNSRTENQTRFIDTLNQSVMDPLLRRQDAKNSFIGTVFKADAIVKKLAGFKLETGYKFSFIQTTNDPVFLRQMGGGGFAIDQSRTIYFRYREAIHAVYGIINRSYKRTEVQAGLRLENASGKGYQRNNDSSFTRHWLNLFPSAFVRHNVNKDYQIVFNYSRRITRPSARNLSPFAYFTDSLYSNTGNPYIQPQFAHVVEWRNIIKNKFTITASFNQVSDMIMFMIIHEPQFKTIRATVYNFDDYRTWTLSAALPLRFTKAWQATFNLATGLTHAKGTLLNIPINQKIGYASVNMSNVFTLSPLWGADINLNYTTPQLGGLLKITRPLIYSVGIRRKSRNNLGSFTLSMQTPFVVPRYNIDVNYATTVYDSRFHTASQSFILTYSVRFGKQTVAQQRNKANAAAEEERRM